MKAMASSDRLVNAGRWKGFAGLRRREDSAGRCAKDSAKIWTCCQPQRKHFQNFARSQTDASCSPRRSLEQNVVGSVVCSKLTTPCARARPEARTRHRDWRRATESSSGSVVVGEGATNPPVKRKSTRNTAKSDGDDGGEKEEQGNVEKDNMEEVAGAGPGSADPGDVPKGVTVASMMQMIKDAEKNILLLNRVRMRALEDLEQAKYRSELSANEAQLLQSRLKETDAKLHLLTQTQNKNQLLQEQVEALTAKLGEKDQEVASLKKLEADLETARGEAKRVHAEKDAIEGRLEELERDLTESRQRVEELEKVEQAKRELEARVGELSEKLREEEGRAEARAQLERENELLREGMDELKLELDNAKKDVEGVKEEVASLHSVAGEVSEKERQLAEERERTGALQAQVAKLEGLLTSSAKVRERNRMEEKMAVQKELEAVQARLQASEESVNRLEAERGELERQRTETEERVRALEVEAGKVPELEERLTRAESAMADASQGLREVQTEADSLRRERKDLQSKLSEAESKVQDLRTSVNGKAGLEERVQDLEALLKTAEEAVVEAKKEETARNKALDEAAALAKQVRLLEASVKELEAEREIWAEAEQEKALLQQQVALLKEQLVQSDADMQAQVEMYKSEVEAFQEDMERLRVEGLRGSEPKAVPVGEMPWEFWSDLLLRLDALMLDRHLTLDQAVELRLMAWHRDPRIRDVYSGLEQADDVSAAAGLLKLIEGKMRPGMHIVHIAAEMAPVAKVGGLADVVTGLGRALQKKGHLVEFVLPKYDCMDYSRVQDLKVIQMDLESYFDGQMHRNRLWRGIVEGLPVYFIEPHHPGRFFWRNAFYGEADDFKRFTYFCRAALEFIHKAGKKPDVIHCHDWQTALVAPLFWDVYAPRGMDTTQVAFTCHNFEYQGTDAPAALSSAGLDWREYYRPDRMQDNFMLDRINLLKGGIVFSNVVTTVSPTYSREVLGPEGGRGLHPTLLQHRAKFSGVLNGIDNDAWDPATDPLLEFQYSAENVDSKYANKYALRQKLGLSTEGDDEGRPLVGCVTRLVPQKGVHLIRHAIYRTLEMGGQFILLGNSPVPSIQRDFEGIARHFDRSPHVRLVLKYDEALSHMIYSASDMFVIPSMFEPCGLTQLIAMRYGAIPIARKTGGLNDSVFDVDDGTVAEHKKNGFCFTATDEAGLNYALDRAFDYYWEQPEFWQKLVQKAMRMDWGWDGPSEEYLALYRKAVIAGQK
ncbi:starch synthase [Klebsormidium nitens]|uniref:starch synthase n=1 Tax=Klebsormidium nitens TaxID=105231 RepID=A0A1Y1HNE2_KLENI|nr:starch synthase [Klebsormidium nitens]|eukprot:GAQ78501.1 starch synthase [Klebsormidium nitens]